MKAEKLNKTLLKEIKIRNEKVKVYSINATYVRTRFPEYPESKDWNSGGHYLGWGKGMEFIVPFL